MSGIGSTGCYPDSLVGKFLGTAYDTVKLVADHMTDIENASNISVNLQNQIDAINDRLNYIPISIESISLSTSIVQKGSSVSNLILNWTLNKEPTSQNVNLVPIDATLRSETFTGPYTTNQLFELTVVDQNNNSDSETVNLQFINSRYWGVNASNTITDVILLASSNELSSSKSKDVTYNASGGRYIYYAYPASEGNVSVKINGLNFSDYTITQRSHTNASGYSELYNVIVFNNIQNGSNILVEYI